MSAVVKGRNVSVEVASAFVGSPIAVSGVSKANPAIVTAPLHGLVEWAVGYFSGMVGMVPLEGQAAAVTQPITADSFSTVGLDTRSYPAGGTGNFTRVTAWLTLTECTSYQLTTGQASRISRTTILDRQARSRPGLLPQQTLSLNILPQTVPSAALELIRAAATGGGAILLRIVHKVDGSLRLCRGDPSYPNEGLQVGAIGSASIDVAIDGVFLSLASVYTPPAPPGPESGTFSEAGFDEAAFDA